MMGRFQQPKVIAPVDALEDPKEWDYLADLELMKSRGNSVYLTLEHVTYICDQSCVALFDLSSS